MALIHRTKSGQPPLLHVDAEPIAPPPAREAKKRPAPIGERYWPEVVIVPEARQRLESLEIWHSSVRRAFQETLASLLENHRCGELPSEDGIGEMAVMPVDDLPGDIRVVYQYSKHRILIFDVRRPDQPALFGVPSRPR